MATHDGTRFDPSTLNPNPFSIPSTTIVSRSNVTEAFTSPPSTSTLTSTPTPHTSHLWRFDDDTDFLNVLFVFSVAALAVVLDVILLIVVARNRKWLPDVEFETLAPTRNAAWNAASTHAWVIVVCLSDVVASVGAAVGAVRFNNHFGSGVSFNHDADADLCAGGADYSWVFFESTLQFQLSSLVGLLVVVVVSFGCRSQLFVKVANAAPLAPKWRHFVVPVVVAASSALWSSLTFVVFVVVADHRCDGADNEASAWPRHPAFLFPSLFLVLFPFVVPASLTLYVARKRKWRWGVEKEEEEDELEIRLEEVAAPTPVRTDSTPPPPSPKERQGALHESHVARILVVGIVTILAASPYVATTTAALLVASPKDFYSEAVVGVMGFGAFYVVLLGVVLKFVVVLVNPDIRKKTRRKRLQAPTIEDVEEILEVR